MGCSVVNTSVGIRFFGSMTFSLFGSVFFEVFFEISRGKCENLDLEDENDLDVKFYRMG